ncbi:MAG: hypothetical protein JXA42_13665 [Anaerolineales bacterium]|nr:hypothetical protein [Anaerolineales bacterium]
MGTSMNQGSPRTPNWRAASIAYISDSIPLERAVQEIWRAAENQPEGNLPEELANPIVAKCLEIAKSAQTHNEASHDSRRAIAISGQASLAADIAQRAVVQSFQSKENREKAFAQALFSEAIDYLVSRDLPGYVGVGGRVKTVSQAIEFKNAIRSQVIRVINEIPQPSGLKSDPSIWRKYVFQVVSHLTGRR